MTIENNKTIFSGIKAIIFDLDGTLYDSGGLPYRLIMAKPSEMFVLHKERTVRTQIRGYDFVSAEAFYKEFFSRLSRLTGKSEDHMREWYFSHYMPRMMRVLKKNYDAYPGVEDIFRNLEKAGISYAVYSDYPNTDGRLKAIGLNPAACGKLYSPEDFGALKPSPRPFRIIAAELGATPAETLVIGDRDDTDGEGARLAGMPFLQVRTRKNAKKQPRNDTALHLYTWKELRSLLSEFTEDIQTYKIKKA